MADAPTPQTSGTSLTSFFAGNKRIPSDSFWAYMFSAIAVDVVLGQWMPGAGTVFVCFCRGMYMLNGYKTDKMLTTTAITAAAGFFPIIEDFATVAFVGFTYMTNVAETNKIGSIAAVAVAGKLQKGKVSDEVGAMAGKDGENLRNDNTPTFDGIRRPNDNPGSPRSNDKISPAEKRTPLINDVQQQPRSLSQAKQEYEDRTRDGKSLDYKNAEDRRLAEQAQSAYYLNQNYGGGTAKGGGLEKYEKDAEENRKYFARQKEDNDWARKMNELADRDKKAA